MLKKHYITFLRVLKFLVLKEDTIKVFKGALSGLRYFLVNESPLKMMENAFYFTLKGFFLSRYSLFILTFWPYSKTT